MSPFDPMALPTPVRPAGKRVVFETPEAAEERVWENYNPHWRYEDYDRAATINTAGEEGEYYVRIRFLLLYTIMH